MRVAFHAPLKAPSHPVPSGDRSMARALQAALTHAGHDVSLVSELRSHDKRGDTARQARLSAAAKLEVARLLAHGDAPTWQAWVTYHNYYKAPDLIGPSVCAALRLPYLLIEATRARKRLHGPWADFAAAAEAACDAAHTIFYLTERDSEALLRDAPKGQHIRPLPPFLPISDLPTDSTRGGPILTVAMMRPGDKLASYTLIAQTLDHLAGDWRLDIAGDGPARAEVEHLFQGLSDRVRFLGALDRAALDAAYAGAACLFWPGVNEAFGMTYLEAQAHGLPIVAQDRPGVRDVVHGKRCDVAAGPAAMAERLQLLLGDTDLRHREGAANRNRIEAHHLLPAAAQRLNTTLEAL